MMKSRWIFCVAVTAPVVAPWCNAQNAESLYPSKPVRVVLPVAPGGGTLHLAVALFEDMAGVKAALIPYKGGGPALVDTVGGQIQMMIVPIVSAIGHVKASRLRALGVSGTRRSPLLPELPTIAEAGVPGYNYTTWYGMCAPAATPKPIIAKLHQGVLKALGSADLRDKFTSLGLEIESGSPEQFATMLKLEVARWGKIIRDAKIQGE